VSKVIEPHPERKVVARRHEISHPMERETGVTGFTGTGDQTNKPFYSVR
jgi:hypothetical protein